MLAACLKVKVLFEPSSLCKDNFSFFLLLAHLPHMVAVCHNEID